MRLQLTLIASSLLLLQAGVPVHATDPVYGPEVIDLRSNMRNVDVRMEQDADTDGFSMSDGDCDDHDPSTYPHANEIADGIDNNCDGLVDN